MCRRAPRAPEAVGPVKGTLGPSDRSGKGAWRDAKGFRFYLIDEGRIVHLLSWHQVQDEADLGEALTQVKNGRRDS